MQHLNNGHFKQTASYGTLLQGLICFILVCYHIALDQGCKNAELGVLERFFYILYFMHVCVLKIYCAPLTFTENFAPLR